MSNPLEKTEEQIAKEKEAVSRMVGAKDSMIKALNRIETLERALQSVQRDLAAAVLAFGDELYIGIYTPREGRRVPENAKAYFKAIDMNIRNVL